MFSKFLRKSIIWTCTLGVAGLVVHLLRQAQTASLNKGCDPITFALWANGLMKRQPNQPTAPFTVYQVREAGISEYLVFGGGERVWADGIRIQDCYLLETKHVDNPKQSPFMPGGILPLVQAKIDAKIDDEIRRYTAVIRDPATPAVGLEIITNQVAAVPYFQNFLTLHATPRGRVVVRP